MKRFIPSILMFGTATIGILIGEKLLFLTGSGLCILFLIVNFIKMKSSD